VAVANVLTPKAFNDLASFQNTIAANISKLLCLFVWIVLYILVRKFKDNIQNFIDNNRTLRVVGQNFIFLFFFSLPNFNIFLNMFLGEVDSKDVYNAVLVVVFIVYSFINVYKQIANVSKEYEQEIQAQQVVLMRNSIDKTRDFRHNFRNTMNIINGYVELGDLDNLRDYMSGLSSEIWSVKTADNIHANLKKIPHLYGLFKDKLAMSEERRVAFELDINLQDEMISRLVPNDLSKIMGILLDNAIEAAEESKGKFVAVSIDRVMKHTSIRITNTYLNKPDPEQIIKDGYTTKKDHTGFGLYEVESIIKKYQDKREKVSITYNCDDAYFIITLNI
jgi:two-component system sensor histidine kinase AgrC